MSCGAFVWIGMCACPQHPVCDSCVLVAYGVCMAAVYWLHMVCVMVCVQWINTRNMHVPHMTYYAQTYSFNPPSILLQYSTR